MYDFTSIYSTKDSLKLDWKSLNLTFFLSFFIQNLYKFLGNVNNLFGELISEFSWVLKFVVSIVSIEWKETLVLIGNFFIFLDFIFIRFLNI